MFKRLEVNKPTNLMSYVFGDMKGKCDCKGFFLKVIQLCKLGTS